MWAVNSTSMMSWNRSFISPVTTSPRGVGRQALVLLDDIFPVVDGGDRGRIGTGSAYALFLHGLDQGCLGIPGRGLGEVLLLLVAGQQSRLPLLEIGQRGLRFLGLVVLALLIDGDEAWEFQALMVGPENMSRRLRCRWTRCRKRHWPSERPQTGSRPAGTACTAPWSGCS